MSCQTTFSNNPGLLTLTNNRPRNTVYNHIQYYIPKQWTNQMWILWWNSSSVKRRRRKFWELIPLLGQFLKGRGQLASLVVIFRVKIHSRSKVTITFTQHVCAFSAPTFRELHRTPKISRIRPLQLKLQTKTCWPSKQNEAGSSVFSRNS